MRDTVKANLTSWLSDSETGNNPTLQLVAGIIYMEEGDFEEAAKVPLLPSPPPPPLERFLILCLNLQHKIRLDQTRLDQIISSMLPLILPPRPDQIRSYRRCSHTSYRRCSLSSSPLDQIRSDHIVDAPTHHIVDAPTPPPPYPTLLFLCPTSRQNMMSCKSLFPGRTTEGVEWNGIKNARLFTVELPWKWCRCQFRSSSRWREWMLLRRVRCSWPGWRTMRPSRSLQQVAPNPRP